MAPRKRGARPASTVGPAPPPAQDPDRRPLRSDAAANRDRILLAAYEAFTEGGLDVPLDEVARRAGVGPGTLHRHFPTKGALVVAAIAQDVAALAAEATDRADADDPAEALVDVLERLVRRGAASHAIAARLPGSVDVDRAVAAPLDDLRRALAVLLARAQDVGRVDQEVTAGDLDALLAGAHAVLVHPDGTPALVRRVCRSVLTA